MIALTVIIVLLVLLLMGTTYLLGFRLGGSETQTEISRVRADASEAARQMNELTQAALLAMAEESERQRRIWP